VLLGHPQPVVKPVDDDDALCAEQDRSPGCHLPDGPAAPHSDYISGLDVAHVRAHPPGRRGVGGEERGLIVERLRH
jgi:hypothetical protein